MRIAHLLVAFASCMVAGCGCSGSPPAPVFLDADAPAVPADKLAGLTGSETLGELVRRLGPAHEDRGSGMYVLEWRVADGRCYYVSVTALQEAARPYGAGFADR